MNYIATVISNRSNGYIHLYWTGPPTFSSNGRCIGDAPLSQKMMEGISSQVCIEYLDDIHFKPLNVINIQLAGA
jgi:hypothetical protein